MSNHTHHVSGGGKHSHPVNDPGHSHTTDGVNIISGIGMDIPGSGIGWAFVNTMSTEKTGITIGEADINIDTNTEGPNTNNTNTVGGNEARPTNYTIVIWKRIS